MKIAEERIRDNWAFLLSQVDGAARVAGRQASEIRVIGVTKYVDIGCLKPLFEAGCRNFAESRPQSLWTKADAFTTPEVQWHLIGHLQRNKIKRTIDYGAWLHSIDSLRLLMQLEQEAAAKQLRPKVLLEVNVTQDTSKTGATLEELRNMIEFATTCHSVEVLGLMGMSSLAAMASADRSSLARSEFARIRELRDRLQSQAGTELKLTELSMGMSGDFREAILEGSTMIRIGSALFEGVLDDSTAGH